LNQEFLSLMADVANEHSAMLVLYVIPLNPIADNPYIQEQYASFKIWLQQFAYERNLPFANLENLVPHDDWGVFNGGPDYKHFREHGHELTAAALMEYFGDVLGRHQPRLPEVTGSP
jgi:lysophospholipase L1-like esterase